MTSDSFICSSRDPTRWWSEVVIRLRLTWITECYDTFFCSFSTTTRDGTSLLLGDLIKTPSSVSSTLCLRQSLTLTPVSSPTWVTRSRSRVRSIHWILDVHTRTRTHTDTHTPIHRCIYTYVHSLMCTYTYTTPHPLTYLPRTPFPPFSPNFGTVLLFVDFMN